MAKRVWPNLYIVGAVKSGTTSLYAYLGQHPQVFFPHIKEPHFFTQPHPSSDQAHLITYVKTEVDYLRLYERSGDYAYAGDASPSYLWCPEAPNRIYAVAPQARIIIILRDPVERAYAQYLMDYSEGVLHTSFYDALQQDWLRPDKGWGVSQLYVELGQYTEQIRRYRTTFGAEHVLILTLEELKRGAHDTLKRIAQFLGIIEGPLAHIDTTTVHNPYRQPKGEWARRLAGSPMSRFLGEHVVPRRLGEFIWAQWMQKDATKPPIDDRAQKFLEQLFGDELMALERELGKSYPELRRSWRYHASVAA